MKRTTVLSCASVLLHSLLQAQPQAPSGDHYVPLEKKIESRWGGAPFEPHSRYAYEGEALTAIGMPCGGICAGQMYVRGDGTLAQWWISNNAHNTGYGIYPSLTTPSGTYRQAYQTFRPYSPVTQGFVMRVFPKGGTPVVRELCIEDFPGIRFYGEYPVAEVEYSDGEDPSWPVALTAEVFSPFIPLNARDSAIPVTVLQYRLKNRSKRRVDVSLAGWIQNPVMLDLKGRVGAVGRNTLRREEGLTCVYMDAVPSESAGASRRIIPIDDFESGTLENWTVLGDAFGIGEPGSVPGIEGSYYVTSYDEGDEAVGRLISKPFRITEAYLVFSVGAGRMPGGTRVQLVVDGEVVRSGSGRMRNERLEANYFEVSEYAGMEGYIEIVDEGEGEFHHIHVDAVYLSNLPPLPRIEFSEDHPQHGNVSLTVLDGDGFGGAAWLDEAAFRRAFEESGLFEGLSSAEMPIGKADCGVVGTRVRLEPGREQTIVFFVSWYFPNRRQRNLGAGWGRPVGEDGPHVGNMYRNWFGDAMDVVRYVSDEYDRLRGDTFLFRDRYFDTTLPYWFVQRLGMPLANLATESSQWWGDGRFWGWEGVGCCFGTCTHVWNYAQGLARIFPELERSVRTFQDFGDGMDPSTGRVGVRGRRETPPHFLPALDGQAGTILKAYREHSMCSDRNFLGSVWPGVKKAMGWLLEQDEGGDGLLEGVQPNTYDIAFRGANTFVGSLYLASLRACETMALEMGEDAYARELRLRFEKGRESTVNRLWNGEYFIQDVDPIRLPEHQYGTGCLSDQVFGQSWAHQVGLDYIYPEDLVQRALKSIWDYNWAPHVGMQNRVHAPERYYAEENEPGLLMCTWPGQSHPKDRAVRYRNEVWTGIEYQVASHMLYEGMTEEAFAIVRGIHHRYDGARHNPWNEVECGDHYARALASWGCLLAVGGFSYHGPDGMLGFAPRVTPEDFRVFFTGAEGWGNLGQTRSLRTQTDIVEVAWGRLNLRKIELALPEGAVPRETRVTHRDRMLGARTVTDGRDVSVMLDAPVTVERGETLKIAIDW